MANELQVYIKELGDASWTDITSRVVRANFKIKEGFGSLGGSLNLSKLDITYKASDLAVASIFHTTAKIIRIKKNGAVIWEGFTEGSSTVNSTDSSELAWVKVTAYPYIHALEKIVAPADEVFYDIFISKQTTDKTSLLERLWTRMIGNAESPYREFLKDSVTIIFPTIEVKRPIVVIEEGDNYLTIFNKILKQYGFVFNLDGFIIRFVQPFADDYREIKLIPFSKIETKPTIKTAPYKSSSRPIITISKIITRDNCQVYSLAQEGENAEHELYINSTFPEEGEYEDIKYSNQNIETDNISFYYAKNPSMSYQARYSDNSADAVLAEEVKELNGTGAKVKLRNTSTVLSCYLNQLKITAEKAYFLDKTTQVTPSASTIGDKKEETTEWLSTETDANNYINFLLAEQKAETSSFIFKSGLLGNEVRPNNLIKIGDIQALYLVRNISTDITNNEKEYSCVLFELQKKTTKVYAMRGLKRVGAKGNKGDRGANGSSNALITLYKRSATQPESYDGGALTYTFATDTLSGNLGSWSRSITSGSNPLYAITARAYGTGETDIIDIGEWSTPAILSENGTKGENGSTVAVITLYKRGDSAPATPSKTVSFSFHTYTVTNSDGWTLGIPSGSAPCWSIYATAVSSDGVSDTIEPSEWSTPIKAFENGSKGDKGDKGDTGTAGSYLSFFVSRILVDCYAEGDIIGDEKITFNAQSDGEITLEIDSTPIKTATRLLEYSATPAQVLGDKQSVLVVAKTSKIQQSYTISRVIRKGSLSITADKSSIPFYADNVPHSSTDKITLSISAVNYKNTPKLYLNGVLQTTESKSNYTFEVSQSAFKNADTIVAKIICGQDIDSIVLSKALDIGSLTLTADKTSFEYYADNVAVNASEKATISIEQQGYSKMPDLVLNSVKTTYTSTGNKGSYSIPVTALQDISSLEVKIANEKEMKALQIIKTKLNPSITLQVSTPVVEFYYDNVAISGNVTVTVKYSGLFYAPLCKIGTTQVALSSAGVGTISISSFKDVDSLTVDAYAQKNLVYSVSQTITKTKRPLNLSIGASATQFSYDSKNAVSPSSITLTNYTTGLSNSKLVVLKVGGTAKTWSDTNTFSITPDMITGRYLNVELSYGTEKTSMIITKTYDGKAEIIQYSKTKSFKIYPDDEYSFTYNASGLTYNGQTFVWTITWSENIPDISSNEYLWRRSRNSETDAWQYTRLTGIQGDKGEQGGGEYLGHYTTAPTKKPNGDALANGDYYLNTATVGSPLPYRYKNGQWVLITTSDKDWSQIASATMEDVNNYGGALLSTSSYYAFFQLLSAQKAFVKSLGAQNITLNENGLIQSENYESTEGAEGFRINADGSVDFSTGTWRGSFANGLSFIPATHMIAKRTMTHKQVYQAMKKAGIVSGIYKTADLQAFVDTGAISGENGASAPYTSSGINTGNGFACFDYAQSALTMNIPLFTTFSGILPINPDLYLIFHGTKNGSTVTKNVYLVTKTMLATAQFNTTEIYDFTSLKQYPQTSLVNCITISADDKPKVVFIGAVVNGKLIAHDIEAGTVGLYSFNTSTMSTTKEATLSLISSSWTIERGYAPSYNYHEYSDSSGKYWETSLVSADFKSFAISKTVDLKTYNVVSTYTTSYTSNPPIPLDVVRVGSRIFGQILEQTTVSNAIHNNLYFAEYNTTTKKWDRIPDSYSTVEDLASINIPSLLVKNGVIFGSKSGYDFFSYNPTTSVFTDLSSILKTGLPTTVSCDKKIKELVEVVKPLTFDYVTNYTNNTVKYSKIKHWQNLRVTGISWSTKLNALIISANVHENDGIYSPLFNIVYSYDIATEKTKMISPIFAAIETENTTAEFNPINPYVESSSSYAISAGNSVLVSEIPTANELSFTVNNVKLTDLFSYFNGEKTLDATLFPTASSVPLGIKSQFQLWASLEKEVLLSKAVEYGDNRLYNTTDTTLTFHCAVPFAHETKMIIREKADAYEIILGTYRLLGYSSGMFPSFFGPNNKSMMSILKFEIFSSADAEPILTVKKNSDEDFNASFIWDFPAQLTVAEDIKTVVKADVFRDNITITNKS